MGKYWCACCVQNVLVDGGVAPGEALGEVLDMEKLYIESQSLPPIRWLGTRWVVGTCRNIAQLNCHASSRQSVSSDQTLTAADAL